MSWSIRIERGDISVSPASFATVTGGPKLVQDLRCWILEHMGNDDMHPALGSVIDGGTTPDGTEIAGVIGTDDWREASAFVEAEIRRICREYQKLQLARAKQDKLTLGRATLIPSEILREVADIQFSQVGDNLNVYVQIATGTNQTFDLELNF